MVGLAEVLGVGVPLESRARQLERQAQQAVVGGCAQAQRRADDVVAQRLHAAGHQAVVARQVTRARGQRGQIGQRVGVGAGTHRVPIHQRQAVVGRLVGRHLRATTQVQRRNGRPPAFVEASASGRHQSVCPAGAQVVPVW